ncbi:hypothetical protein VTJ83DRAFT_2867 [Remersonia thermophila]|uniref:Uncharacterized protein n=1 Tax=Remersonia thermophila TaxID=72144 RepID=A0ABR4DCF1_9PEZI
MGKGHRHMSQPQQHRAASDHHTDLPMSFTRLSDTGHDHDPEIGAVMARMGAGEQGEGTKRVEGSDGERETKSDTEKGNETEVEEADAEKDGMDTSGDDDDCRRPQEGSGQGEARGQKRRGFAQTLRRVIMGENHTGRCSKGIGTEESAVEIEPPPDGGWRAWVAVASTHLIVMNTWGMVSSFGVFQAHYTVSLSRPPSDISWIGSVQIFLLFFVGALAGRLTDAGYFRPVFLLGAALQIGATFAASAATRYWHVLLSQGIALGLANGLLFCPCMATLTTYFDRRRSLAIGMAACGGATGGLVFPSIVRQLLPRQGMPAAMRALGYVQLAAFVVALLGLKRRVPPRRSGPWVEWTAFTEAEYALFVAAGFSLFTGLYFAFYYIASFSRDVIGISYTESLNLLLVLNGVGYPGRLVPNHLADKAGPLTMLVPVLGMAGVCLFVWMAVTSTAGMYVWCVFYGLFAGGVQSLFPAGLSSLTADPRKAGVRMGMAFTIVSFATLAGPPIAGAIISAQGGNYHGAEGFAGACLLLSTGLMAAARMAKARRIVRETGIGGRGWKVKV